MKLTRLTEFRMRVSSSANAFALALFFFTACTAAPFSPRARESSAPHSEVRNDSLVFNASAMRQDGPSPLIRVQVTVLNHSDHDVVVEAPGGCPVTFQLLSALPPNGKQLWDSAVAPSSMGCALSLEVYHLAPGTSRAFKREVEETEIRGDSLRGGRYFVQAKLALNSDTATLFAGELALSD
jgi:hypothetical protein